MKNKSRAKKLRELDMGLIPPKTRWFASAIVNSEIKDRTKKEDYLRNLLTKHIRNSSKLNQVEECFQAIASETPGELKKDLLYALSIAKQEFSKPCVLVIPSNSFGIDAVPGNFELLSLTNKDFNSIKLYDQQYPTGKFIPCYLFSIDILGQNGNVPEDFEYQLYMIAA